VLSHQPISGSQVAKPRFLEPVQNLLGTSDTNARTVMCNELLDIAFAVFLETAVCGGLERGERVSLKARRKTIAYSATAL
jgi:hypothetical protein